MDYFIGYKLFAVRNDELQSIYINYLYPLKYYGLRTIKENEWLNEEDYCPEQMRMSRNIKNRGFHLFNSLELCLDYFNDIPKYFRKDDLLLIYKVEYDNIIFERDGIVRAYCIRLIHKY